MCVAKHPRIKADPTVLGIVRSTTLRPHLKHISSTHNVLIHCSHQEVTLSASGPPGSDLSAAERDLRVLIESVSRDISREPLVLHCCYIPLLASAPVVSRIDEIHEKFGANISVVTTSGDFVAFSDFVSNTNRLRSGADRHDSLLLVSEVSRFAEMRLNHNWRYKDATGEMRNFPPSISGLLNEKYYPFHTGIHSFSFESNRYSVDFSRMVVVQEGSDKFGKIDNEPLVWRYSENASAASPSFSRSFDSVTSQEIDLAVQYGAPGLLTLEGSEVTLDTLANPVVLHDLTKGSKWHLLRNPPLGESRDCLVTLAVSCRRVDLLQVELALHTLLQDQVATQMYTIPPNTPPALQCLLVNIARQFCIRIIDHFDVEASTRLLKLEGEREYVFAVKVHLLEAFQQKIAPLAIEKNPTIPHHWKPGQRSTVETVPVSMGAEEWSELEGLLKQSLPSVQLVAITRIQNLMLWRRYCFFKSLMSRKNGSDQVNEKLLFHGSRTTDPKTIITSEKGFDFRYGSDDCWWGKGMYFAVRASYCDNRFAFRTPQGNKQILVGRVLTGRSVFLPRPRRELKEPPKLPNSVAESYDSVNGVIPNPVKTEVYVIYDHDKAYPAYLITYI